MATIDKVPHLNQTFDTMTEPYFWEQSPECSGFLVGDDCPWRAEEMSLVTFRPQACSDGDVRGCE